ncbi:unnamed protein product, partial [Iphiclides podalirius]
MQRIIAQTKGSWSEHRRSSTRPTLVKWLYGEAGEFVTLASCWLAAPLSRGLRALLEVGLRRGAVRCGARRRGAGLATDASPDGRSSTPPRPDFGRAAAPVQGTRHYGHRDGHHGQLQPSPSPSYSPLKRDAEWRDYTGMRHFVPRDNNVANIELSRGMGKYIKNNNARHDWTVRRGGGGGGPNGFAAYRHLARPVSVLRTLVARSTTSRPKVVGDRSPSLATSGMAHMAPSCFVAVAVVAAVAEGQAASEARQPAREGVRGCGVRPLLAEAIIGAGGGGGGVLEECGVTRPSCTAVVRSATIDPDPCAAEARRRPDLQTNLPSA